MKRNLNNKGYSLVELLVVIALMTVGLSLFTISVATMFTNNVRQTAADIDSQISRGIVSSNYRDPLVYIEIDRNGDGNLVVRYYEGAEATAGVLTHTLIDERVVGGANINIFHTGFISSGSGGSDNLPLRMAFRRGTGEILDISDPANFNTVSGTARFAPAVRPTIRLDRNGSGFFTITLTPHTGGHEVRRG